MSHSQKTNDQRLRSLAAEISALQEDLLALSLERNEVATRRDIKRLSERLDECQEQWRAVRVEPEVCQAYSTYLEPDPAKARHLPAIPDDVSFGEALRLLAPRITSTPASIWHDYCLLRDEGCERPLDEIADDLSVELVCGLLYHTAYRPEEINSLQEQYLEALSRQLASRAIRGWMPPGRVQRS